MHGLISHNAVFILVIHHHPSNLGLKFQLKQYEYSLNTTRVYVYTAIAYNLMFKFSMVTITGHSAIDI